MCPAILARDLTNNETRSILVKILSLLYKRLSVLWSWDSGRGCFGWRRAFFGGPETNNYYTGVLHMFNNNIPTTSK
jgi:hypothetical protein